MSVPEWPLLTQLKEVASQKLLFRSIQKVLYCPKNGGSITKKRLGFKNGAGVQIWNLLVLRLSVSQFFDAVELQIT